MSARREKLRWKVAHLLDRSKRLCWADLASWAAWGHPLRECRVDWTCREGAERTGSCYCGKVRAPATPEGEGGSTPRSP